MITTRTAYCLLFVHTLRLLWTTLPSEAQQGPNYTVSALNRTARVKSDGSWVVPNIPANFGQVRARATCVTDGVTQSGQSDFFRVPPSGSVNVADIPLNAMDPIPASVAVTAPTATLG